MEGVLTNPDYLLHVTATENQALNENTCRRLHDSDHFYGSVTLAVVGIQVVYFWPAITTFIKRRPMSP